jgi:hypothetical protein
LWLIPPCALQRAGEWDPGLELVEQVKKTRLSFRLSSGLSSELPIAFGAR